MIATWSTRYLPRPDADSSKPGAALAEGDVRVVEQDGFTQEVQAGRHALIADEPIKVGGHDLGPTPYDYVLAGLGACTSMTLRMYANHKKWPLEGVEVTARHSRVHATDCEDCEPGSKLDRFERDLVVTGPLSEEQRARLVEIANRCPVHRTLEAKAEIVTRLVEPA